MKIGVRLSEVLLFPQDDMRSHLFLYYVRETNKYDDLDKVLTEEFGDLVSYAKFNEYIITHRKELLRKLNISYREFRVYDIEWVIRERASTDREREEKTLKELNGMEFIIYVPNAILKNDRISYDNIIKIGVAELVNNKFPLAIFPESCKYEKIY